MIIPIYKPLGASSHQLAHLFGTLHRVKATHTGTLDPMAEGVLVVVSENDRFKKSEYSAWNKQYQFTVLGGGATDSHDLLGLVTEWQTPKITSNLFQSDQLKKVLSQLSGEYQQKLPTFSARRNTGESYFDKAKRNELFITDSQKIIVHQIEVVNQTLLTVTTLKKTITAKIGAVKGDFRQEQIIATWDKYLSALSPQTLLPLLTFKATTSKRAYIRGIVRDLSQLLDIPLTTYELIRTANGPYTISDCVCLI